jgi:hypothetical protein
MTCVFLIALSRLVFALAYNPLPFTRGGLGWGWVTMAATPGIYPIPFLTCPLKGEELKAAKT